jgi:hypothetical protein
LTRWSGIDARGGEKCEWSEGSVVHLTSNVHKIIAIIIKTKKEKKKKEIHSLDKYIKI